MASSALLEQFFVDGYVCLPQVVAPECVKAALRMANKTLGQTPLEKRDLIISADDSILSMFNRNEAIKNAVGTLLGIEARCVPMVAAAQLAFRMPGDLCVSGTFLPVPAWNSMWHIDGLDKPPRIGNFTLLVGVALRDVLEDFEGNLVVYPRSHHVLERYFTESGFDDAHKGLKTLPVLPFAEPKQVRLKAGDCVVAHYQLAHSIAPNTGAEIRTMVYFRINVRQDGFRPEAMLDAWNDFSPAFRNFAALPPMSEGETSVARHAGYTTSVIAHLLDEDASRHPSAVVLEKAERLLEEKNWTQAAPLFVELAAAPAASWMIIFKAGICLTAGSKQHLREGEGKLRQARQLAPSQASVATLLAVNLKRQVEELDNRFVRREAILLARQGLLELALAPDCAVQAMEALRDLEDPDLSVALSMAISRYPELKDQLVTSGTLDPGKWPWEAGKRWLASPKKDVKAGVEIFENVVRAVPRDYWGNLLLGGCLFWSGRPYEALSPLNLALEVDPCYPHSYSILAQVFFSVKKPAAAGQCVVRMLNVVPALKLDEPDHYDKVVEAMQVAKKVFSQMEYSPLRETAIALFPSIAHRFP